MKGSDICGWYDICPFKKFYSEDRLDKKWIKNYCWGNYSKCVRKRMEEEGRYHPDNMMPDGTIDKSLK